MGRCRKGPAQSPLSQNGEKTTLCWIKLARSFGAASDTHPHTVSAPGRHRQISIGKKHSLSHLRLDYSSRPTRTQRRRSCAITLPWRHDAPHESPLPLLVSSARISSAGQFRPQRLSLHLPHRHPAPRAVYIGSLVAFVLIIPSSTLPTGVAAYLISHFDSRFFIRLASPRSSHPPTHATLPRNQPCPLQRPPRARTNPIGPASA